MSTGRGRPPQWAAAVGAVLVIGGLGSWLMQSPVASTSKMPGGDATTQARDTPPPGTGTIAKHVRAPWEPGAPRRVVIPALRVDAGVVPVEAPDDTLIPPTDPQQLGWWADGARPGAERGSALVTGHTVHTGGGALNHLEDLTRGDRVVVRTDRGRIAYRVDRVRTYSKGRIARDAERLFSQDVPGRLVLITCEDWDGSQYLSNVVVIAQPVSG